MIMTRVNWTDDFKKLYKENGQHPYVIRLLALSKMQEGYAIEHIKPMVNKTAKTLRLWKRLYEAGGLEALLKIKSGRGRKPKIKADLSVIKEEIKTLGANKKGGRVIAEKNKRPLKKTPQKCKGPVKGTYYSCQYPDSVLAGLFSRTQSC